MTTQILKSQLSQFGLNPNDWSIVKQKENRYQITARNDKSFSFTGITKQKLGKKVWQKIELISL